MKRFSLIWFVFVVGLFSSTTILLKVQESLALKSSKTITNKNFLDEVPEDLSEWLKGIPAARVVKFSKKLASTFDTFKRTPIDVVASQRISKARSLLDKEPHDDPLWDALESFVRLPKVVEMCDYDGYIELVTNYLLIRGEPKELLETRDALSQVILYFAHKHKENCLPKYELLYNEFVREHKENAQTAELYRVVEELFDDELINSFVQLGSDPLVVPIDEFQLTNESALRKLIANLKKDESADLKPLFEGQIIDVQQLFNSVRARIVGKRLRRNCSDFTWLLKDVFSTARLDALLFGGKPTDAGSGEQFLRHWRLYRICTAIRRADEAVLAENITELMR